jgi:hypothetical protein
MLAGLIVGWVQIAGYRFSYLIGAGLGAAGLALLALTRPSTVVNPGRSDRDDVRTIAT